MEPFIRLPLKNAYNVRDLGGYACANGSRTRWHKIVRADDLSQLDAMDIEFLLNYGLSTVIDLRSPQECERHPNPFHSNPEVKYVRQSLGLNGVDDVSRFITDEPSVALERFYKGILETCGDSLRMILETIAQVEDGAVLFHCTVGKDRTGIVAALLLAAAGVSTTDIIANYMVSFEYVQENPFVREALKLYPPELFHSPAQTMRTLMDIIDREHGGIEAYLSSINVSEHTINAIRKRFCGG